MKSTSPKKRPLRGNGNQGSSSSEESYIEPGEPSTQTELQQPIAEQQPETVPQHTENADEATANTRLNESSDEPTENSQPDSQSDESSTGFLLNHGNIDVWYRDRWDAPAKIALAAEEFVAADITKQYKELKKHRDPNNFECRNFCEILHKAHKVVDLERNRDLVQPDYFETRTAVFREMVLLAQECHRLQMQNAGLQVSIDIIHGLAQQCPNTPIGEILRVLGPAIPPRADLSPDIRSMGAVSLIGRELESLNSDPHPGWGRLTWPDLQVLGLELDHHRRVVPQKYRTADQVVQTRMFVAFHLHFFPEMWRQFEQTEEYRRDRQRYWSLTNWETSKRVLPDRGWDLPEIVEWPSRLSQAAVNVNNSAVAPTARQTAEIQSQHNTFGRSGNECG